MNRKGYFLAEAMIAIVILGVVASAFTAMSYYANVESNLLKLQNTKLILDIARSRLIHESKDVDSDSFFELLKENNDSTIPLQIGVGTDAWGRRIHYITSDFGDKNDVNSSYADTQATISPNDNILGRLMSYGEDGMLQTDTTDATAQEDDIMIEIGVGEVNHFKLYGGSEISTQTRNYNSAIVSDEEPSNPNNGTLWFDTNASETKIYNEGNWTKI